MRRPTLEHVDLGFAFLSRHWGHGYARESAAAVVQDLEAKGFTSEDVTLLSNQDEASNAQIGATTGAALGSGAGLLAGLGLLAVPGLGPLVAAGWLVPVLAAGVAGAMTGGILGALTDAGVEEPDAHVYAETLRRGGALVIVRTSDDRAAAVHQIFAQTQALDAAARRRAYQDEGWKRFEDRV